jgi:hypothetical protein
MYRFEDVARESFLSASVGSADAGDFEALVETLESQLEEIEQALESSGEKPRTQVNRFSVRPTHYTRVSKSNE